MRARRRVDARLRKHEPLDGSPTEQVARDDLGHVGRLHESVPDLLGINDYGYTVFTLIQATGLVRTNPAAGVVPFQLGLERLANGVTTAARAAAAWMAGWALVTADEDVSFELRHALARNLYKPNPISYQIIAGAANDARQFPEVQRP